MEADHLSPGRGVLFQGSLWLEEAHSHELRLTYHDHHVAVQGKGCQSNIPRNFHSKKRTSRLHPKGSHLEGETWAVGFMRQLAGPPLPTFRALYSQEPKQEALLAMWSDCMWNCFRTRWKTLCSCMWGSSLPGPEQSPGVAGVGDG